MRRKYSPIVVVGCGLMGSAIAKALRASELDVIAWNRSPEAAEELGGFGITPMRSLELAIRASASVFIVLSNYDICSSVLSPYRSLLGGKVVVNFTSGTCEQAEEFGQWIRSENADYLDGSIWALPKGISEPSTCLSYSGSRSAWEQLSPVLTVLGGASRYVGQRFGAANALEAAFPGSFYMTSILSFIEGIALCRAYEISDDIVHASLAPMMELLHSGLLQTIQKISSNDYSTDQATLKVFHNAVTSYQGNTLSPVKNSPLSRALLRTLDQACSSGMENKDVAATISRWALQSLVPNATPPVA